MPFLRRSPRGHVAPAPRKQSLLSRLMGPSHTTGTTTTRAPRSHVTTRSRRTHATTPVVHHQRRPSMADKVSGALMRMKGKLTGRSGVKGAGTKRMIGTDGRGATRAPRSRGFGMRRKAVVVQPARRKKGLF